MQRKKDCFQAAKYTEKQVFHDNIKPEGMTAYLLETVKDTYLQVNAWDLEKEHILLLSKKGKLTYKTRKLQQESKMTPAFKENPEHNRRKNYILEEGVVIPPLVDMGVFTKDGKVVKSMYDKFRQINRFIEMIDDGVRDYKKEEIHVIDFG